MLAVGGQHHGPVFPLGGHFVQKGSAISVEGVIG